MKVNFEFTERGSLGERRLHQVIAFWRTGCVSGRRVLVNSMFTLTGCFGPRRVHRIFEFGELHVR